MLHPLSEARSHGLKKKNYSTKVNSNELKWGKKVGILICYKQEPPALHRCIETLRSSSFPRWKAISGHWSEVTGEVPGISGRGRGRRRVGRHQGGAHAQLAADAIDPSGLTPTSLAAVTGSTNQLIPRGCCITSGDAFFRRRLCEVSAAEAAEKKMRLNGRRHFNQR